MADDLPSLATAESLDPTKPWDAVMLALTYSLRGVELPDDLEEAAWEAAGILAAASLVRAGADLEDVERQFVDRPWLARFTYDKATDEIGVSIEWEDDDTVTAVLGPAPH